MWYSLIGCLTTVAIGTIVSFVTGRQDPKELNLDLLSPPIRALLESRFVKLGKKNFQGITNPGLDLGDEKNTKLDSR